MGWSCNKLSPDITLHSKDMMMGLLRYAAERLIIVALLYWHIFVESHWFKLWFVRLAVIQVAVFTWGHDCR